MKNFTTSLLLPSSTFFNASAIKQKELFETKNSAVLNETLLEVKKQLDINNIPFLELQIALEPNSVASFFLNHWISLHNNGEVVLYPSKTNKLSENDYETILQYLEEKGFIIENVVDYTSAMASNIFLEGASSVVFDAENAIVYAAISENTEEELAIEFCEDFDCAPVFFETSLPSQRTNSLIFLGDKFAMIYVDGIKDKKEQKLLLDSLKKSNKEIIFLTETQMQSFVTSSIEIFTEDGVSFILMSTTAIASLTALQVEKIQKFSKIVAINCTAFEAATGFGLASFVVPNRLPLQT